MNHPLTSFIIIPTLFQFGLVCALCNWDVSMRALLQQISTWYREQQILNSIKNAMRKMSCCQCVGSESRVKGTFQNDDGDLHHIDNVIKNRPSKAMKAEPSLVGEMTSTFGTASVMSNVAHNDILKMAASKSPEHLQSSDQPTSSTRSRPFTFKTVRAFIVHTSHLVHQHRSGRHQSRSPRNKLRAFVSRCVHSHRWRELPNQTAHETRCDSLVPGNGLPQKGDHEYFTNNVCDLGYNDSPINPPMIRRTISLRCNLANLAKYDFELDDL